MLEIEEMSAKTKKDYIGMLKEAQALVKKHPEDSEAHIILGKAYGWLNFKDDEMAAYKQAIKLKPDYAEAWAGLSIAYRHAGRKAEAEAAFQKARELGPLLFK